MSQRNNPYRQSIINALMNRASDQVEWNAPPEFNGSDGRKKYAIMLHGVCSYFRVKHPELQVNVHYADDGKVTVTVMQKSESIEIHPL